MLDSAQVKQLVEYWLTSANEKHKTMQSLYKSKRYADCLFFGHLVLEKSLKALVVHKTKKPAPYVHNLSYLAQLAEVDLNMLQKKLLAEANVFNMQTRYPDEKLNFYQLCTKEYTNKYYQPISILHKQLCQLAKQK